MKIQTNGIGAEDWDDFMSGEPTESDNITAVLGEHGDELHLTITDDRIIFEILKIDGAGDSYVAASVTKTVQQLREGCGA